MAWFVYVSTLGNANNDYIVVDRRIAPPDVAQYLTGHGLYMPTSFFPNSHPDLFPLDEPLFGMDPKYDTNRATLGVPARNAAGGDPSAATFVFTTFNKHLKIRPELFDAWCSVLRRLPNSVLWMLRYPKDSEDRLRARAGRFGVEPQLR